VYKFDLIFNILDHICTTCFFANSFGKSFQCLLQIVKGKWVRFVRSIFKIWNFTPCFKCFFLWLNKTPPEWNSPLSFQEGFDKYQLEICSEFRYQFWESIFLRPTPAASVCGSPSPFCAAQYTIHQSSGLRIPLPKMDTVYLHSPSPRLLSPLRTSLINGAIKSLCSRDLAVSLHACE
jgi:hypothetical protein